MLAIKFHNISVKIINKLIYVSKNSNFKTRIDLNYLSAKVLWRWIVNSLFVNHVKREARYEKNCEFMRFKNMFQIRIEHQTMESGNLS